MQLKMKILFFAKMTFFIASFIFSLSRFAYANSQHYKVIELIDGNKEAREISLEKLSAAGAEIRHLLGEKIIIIKSNLNPQTLLRIDTNIKKAFSKSELEHTKNELEGDQNVLSIIETFFNKLDGIQEVERTGPAVTLKNDLENLRGNEDNGNYSTAINAWEATSSYFSGRIIVSFFLMESAGNQENWTTEMENNALAESMECFDDLCDSAYANNEKITWMYDIHYRVPTNWEPIAQNSAPECIIPIGELCLDYDFSWMNDALNPLGYADELSGEYQLINDLRTEYAADWGFITFIVMDQNDPDHEFADGGSAHTHYWGPYLVITYNNGGYGIDMFDAVYYHEILHAFGANDEYFGGGCDENDCSKDYGYLAVPNSNCESCNPNPVICVMRSPWTYNTCYFTKGQIGWHDYDGDLWNEAPDRNFRRSQNIWDVSPGNVIDIYNILGQSVSRIVVTPDKHATNNQGRGFYVWDCSNYEGLQVPNNTYYVNVDGNSRDPILPANDYSAPVLSNLTCVNNVVGFSLYDEDTAGDIVRVSIYQNDNEISRPIQYKLMFQTNHTLDLSFVPPGTYQIQIRAWDSGGNAASPLSDNINIVLLAPVNVTVINQHHYNPYWQAVIINWDHSSNSSGIAIERRTSSSAWLEIDRVTGTEQYFDNNAIGSELYYYRIRSYNGNFYSDYTIPISLRVDPMYPYNVAVTFNNTNSVKLNWSAPIQQLPGVITNYSIRRTTPGYDYIYFGPYTAGPVKICRGNSTNTNYTFGIRTNDIYGHSSLYYSQSGNTGSLNECASQPNFNDDSKRESEDGTYSSETPAIQNWPNPFNSTTNLTYSILSPTEVRISIYNINGQLIRNLYSGFQETGIYGLLWDGTDNFGAYLSSGMYICRFETFDNVETLRLMLVK